MEEQRLEYASWVNTKNMQPIVDKISPLIWTDINIVNMDSIIIASTKIHRIGKYHNAAHLLLNGNKDEIIIEHTNDVPGVLHGVNYPICIENCRVGMIGITGVPSEVMLIAKLVRELLEMHIAQARRSQAMIQLEQLRYSFLCEWLFGQSSKSSRDFEGRANTLGINVHDPWTSCILSLQEEAENKHESIQRYVQRRLDHEEHSELSLCMGDWLIVMLAEEDIKTAKKRMIDLQTAIHSMNGHIFPAGIGRCGREPEQIRQSLQDAKIACRHSAKADDHPACCYDELDLELIVSLLPIKEKRYMFYRVFYDFSTDELEQTMQTLRVYMQHNCSISTAADELHLHKNSLQYRLNKLAVRIGYAPQNASDMAYLYFLTIIYEDCIRGRE